MRIGLVIPHIFMHRDILPNVIFSPGPLALGLAEGLQALGTDVTLFSPGPVNTKVTNITADLSSFEQELQGRGDTYIDLLKKHPLTFISLARQVQSELIAKAFAMANSDQLDIVHIYTNEEDIALPFAQFCQKPVVLTHHDPFSFLIKYKHVFPKYKHLNWISMSLAQRKDMPSGTNWIANIHHGVAKELFKPNYKPASDYVAYLGRIIEPKGTHLAVAAVQQYNLHHADKPLRLKIAGKHYAGTSKDKYWHERIEPELKDPSIDYLGFIDNPRAKQDFLGNATALLVPSTFDEPLGMVMLEALACGTPVIGLDSGAIPEIIKDGQTGRLIRKSPDESVTSQRLARALKHLEKLSRQACRADFEARFTLERMCQNHLACYNKLAS